jgi:hypothetical protein
VLATDPTTDIDSVSHSDLAVFTDAIVHNTPGFPAAGLGRALPRPARHTSGLRKIRRVDAVNVDGRVYQITRLRGEAIAVVIDDQPDPALPQPPTPA